MNLTADALPNRAPFLAALRDSLSAIACALGRRNPASCDRNHVVRSVLSYVLAFAIGYIAYLRVGISLEAVVMTIYAWFLLAVAIIDLEHRLVLNRMLIGALPVVAAVVLLLGMPSPAKALLGGLIGFGVFLLLALLRPGGMGMGDVKLAGLIGLAMGVTGVAISLVVGIVAAGVAGAVLIVLHRFDRRASMAYAPYLALGAWIAMYYLAPAIPSTPL